MHLTRLLPPLLVSLVCTLANAQQMWEWTQDDGNGPRRIVSDRPPPAHLKNIKILRQPKGQAAPTAAAPAAVAANVPKLPTEDKDLMARKKQAEAAETEKERVAKEAEAKVRADNCNRARTVKATLDSGVRVATTGSDGERVVLDDNARAAEMRRVQASIQQNCG